MPLANALPTLSILGTGVWLPPAVDTRAYAASFGADPSGYRGWDHIRVATGDDDHPGDMGAQSLRQALDESGVDAADLKVVVSVGMSRDYLPSWSLATEAMKVVGAPSTCLGVDLTIGCLGTLVGLTTVLGWLMQEGGGYGAIVCGERWAYTIDRSQTELMSLWGHSDGGGALVVGLATPRASLGEYQNA